MNIQQVTTEALNLPVQDRVNLAQALWQSLTHGVPCVDDQTLMATAARRGQELDSGVVEGIGRDDAMRQAREALR